MRTPILRSRSACLIPALLLLAISFLPGALSAASPPGSASPPATASAPTVKAQVDDCLGCHGDKEMTMELPDGGKQPLYVDREEFAASVHGRRLDCTGCHPAEAEIPHPPRKARNRDELVAGFRDVCRSCHFDNFSKALDGVHNAQLQAGNTMAPTCLDCHGSHGISRPGHPRRKVSETCSNCHSEVFEAYSKSVHGKALLEEGNEDVPVCTDCHHSHDIADPRTRQWRLTSTDACGSCHADEKRMKKYGLSTAVLRTWLWDFHGMSADLERSGKAGSKAATALCIDCHGVHDIAKVKDNPSGLRANLLATCRKCHPDATENFPDAWLSHYEPSPKHAPLVWAAGVFYKIFIPFVIGGLVLQVLLHLWRVVVNR